MRKVLILALAILQSSCGKNYESYSAVPDDFIGTFYEVSESTRMGIWTPDTLIITKNEFSIRHGRGIEFPGDSILGKAQKAMQDSLSLVVDKIRASLNVTHLQIVQVNRLESSFDEVVILCDKDSKKTHDFDDVYQATWTDGFLMLYYVGPNDQFGDPQLTLIGRFVRT